MINWGNEILDSQLSILEERQKNPSLKTLLACIFLITQCSLLAQTDQTQQIASGISRYRAFILEQKPAHRQQLGKVLQKLKRLNICEEDQHRLAHFAGRFSREDTLIIPVIPRWHLEGLKLSCPINCDSLSDADLSILAVNNDLYGLVGLGVLELEYPYKVDPDFKLRHELLFYDIQNGDAVAEVGAGNGEFSLVLGAVYDSLILYINELDPSYVAHIWHKARSLEPVLTGDSVIVIHGKYRTSKLSHGYFDKIVVRNTLHHFEEMRPMLRSIHKALKQDGVLLIRENTRDPWSAARCPEAMFLSKIIRKVERAGFVLVDEMRNGKASLLKFSLAR